MDGAPVIPAGDEIVIVVVSYPLNALLLLSPSVRPEQIDGLRVEIDHPRVVALRRRLDDLIGDCGDGVTHREARRLEVNIGRPKPEDLATTHTGHRRKPPDGFEP